MKLKYRGKTKLKRDRKITEIDVYSNDFSLTEVEERLFGEQMGEIIAKYYQNPENQKKFKEWQMQREGKELTNEEIIELGKELKSKLENSLNDI